MKVFLIIFFSFRSSLLFLLLFILHSIVKIFFVIVVLLSSWWITIFNLIVALILSLRYIGSIVFMWRCMNDCLLCRVRILVNLVFVSFLKFVFFSSNSNLNFYVQFQCAKYFEFLVTLTNMLYMLLI